MLVINFHKQQDVEYDMNFNDLLIAIKEKDIKKINIMIDENTFDLSFNENEALLLALYLDNDIIFDKLISCESIQRSLSVNYNYVLFSAVQLSREHAVRELLKNYQVNQSAAINDNYILIKSCAAGNQIIFNMLMSINIVQSNADASENQALINASFEGSYNVVERLLRETKVSENAHAQDNQAIRLAAASGKWGIVSLLAGIPSVVTNISVKNNILLRLAMLADEPEAEWVDWFLSQSSVKDRIANAENLVLTDAVASHNIEYVCKILGPNSVFERVVSYRNSVNLARDNEDFEIESLLRRKLDEYNIEQGINQLPLSVLHQEVVYDLPIAVPVAVLIPDEVYVDPRTSLVSVLPSQGRRVASLS